jgi:methyl-accepting chemotaxis protein
MSYLNLLSLASDFRKRAEEILTRAETMHDPDTRQKMREVAAGSEKLAQRVEQQSGEADEA